MGLGNWLNTLVTGQDVEAEQERGQALDAQIAKQQQAALDSGKWTQAQYDAASERTQASLTGDLQAQVNDAYVEGAKEGLQNDLAIVDKVSTGAADFVNDRLKFGVSTIFRAIPVSVWIIAAVVAFFWLGGAGILRAYIAKKSKA